MKTNTISKEGALAADELGFLHTKLGPLQTLIEVQREILKDLQGRRLFASYDGKKYRATVSVSKPEGFNIELAKTFLTPGQIQKCKKKREKVITIRVVSLKAAGKKRKK